MQVTVSKVGGIPSEPEQKYLDEVSRLLTDKVNTPEWQDEWQRFMTELCLFGYAEFNWR